METKKFKQEWCLLQTQFDSYERHFLYIKLLSIITLFAAAVSNANSVFIVLLLLVLWLQDAIWKTFQSRIESRLLQIEKYILEQSEQGAFQFNSEYHRVRLTGLALINEHARQSVWSTVAFPHLELYSFYWSNLCLSTYNSRR